MDSLCGELHRVVATHRRYEYMKRETTADLALLLVRLGVGAVMVYAGAGKLFGFDGGPGPEGFVGYMRSAGVPEWAAWCAIISEFFGGLGLIFGFLTRIASASVVATMDFATWTKLQPILAKASDAGKFSDVMDPGIYLILSLAILIAGAGQFSLDQMVFGKKSKR